MKEAWVKATTSLKTVAIITCDR